MTEEKGKLGSRIREFKDGHAVSLGDLTVLAPQNDPYRVDTAAGHRDARWFVEQFDQAIGARNRIHLRGLHYAIVARGDVLKPNGQPYINADADWQWLQNFPAKAARWLGYIPFDKIRDNRNDPPIIHRKDASEPAMGIVPGGLSIDLPDASAIEPRVYAWGGEGRQPYHLVIFGEKSSLAEILLPIANRYDADLYLPTGEITDTLLYQMASDAGRDGRPMRVFTLADCDPAGHQMPVSIGRKLQALRDLEFHELDFELRQVALTVDQVRDLGLPSTPLKETEKRGDRWRDAFGIEQTEIDALATLRPDILRRIVRDALAPFYDDTLYRRVRAAHDEWQVEAQHVLDEHIDQDMLAEVRGLAEARLAEVRDRFEEIRNELRVPIPYGIDLPEIKIPDPVVAENLHGKPLVSSSWSWLEMTAALRSHKAYDKEDRA
jgi:hypothetical protein